MCCRYMLVEDLLDGESYVKYNGNNGFVYTPQQAILDAHSRHKNASSIRLDVRNTLLAQAFSHFTYEESGCNEIVVDIQGCGTRWTDPCLHSKLCEYGRTDCGINGISKFFKTHKCNYWCLLLNLNTAWHSLTQKSLCRGASAYCRIPAPVHLCSQGPSKQYGRHLTGPFAFTIWSMLSKYGIGIYFALNRCSSIMKLSRCSYFWCCFEINDNPSLNGIFIGKVCHTQQPNASH